MEILYKLLKKYPDYRVEMCFKDHIFVVKASVTQSCSTKGVDNLDDVETEFTAERGMAILVTIPLERIEAVKVDLIIAEIEWALEELKSISNSSL